MIDFVSLSEQHIPALDAWFIDNSDKWLGHVGYSKELHTLQSVSPNRHCYVALENAEMVAIADLEIEDDLTAWISLVVRPDGRGKGIGKKVLQTLLEQPILENITELKVEIEKDNEASIRCFQAVGFIQNIRPDTTDGFVFLSKSKVKWLPELDSNQAITQSFSNLQR